MLTDIRALADHFLIALPNINRVQAVPPSLLLKKAGKNPHGGPGCPASPRRKENVEGGA